MILKYDTILRCGKHNYLCRLITATKQLKWKLFQLFWEKKPAVILIMILIDGGLCLQCDADPTLLWATVSQKAFIIEYSIQTRWENTMKDLLPCTIKKTRGSGMSKRNEQMDTQAHSQLLLWFCLCFGIIISKYEYTFQRIKIRSSHCLRIYTLF